MTTRLPRHLPPPPPRRGPYTVSTPFPADMTAYFDVEDEGHLALLRPATREYSEVARIVARAEFDVLDLVTVRGVPARVGEADCS